MLFFKNPLFFFLDLFFNLLDIWVLCLFLLELFLESTVGIFKLFKSVHQLNSASGNNFTTSYDHVQKIFSHVEDVVGALYELLLVVEWAFKIMQRDLINLRRILLSKDCYKRVVDAIILIYDLLIYNFVLASSFFVHQAYLLFVNSEAEITQWFWVRQGHLEYFRQYANLCVFQIAGSNCI